MDYVSEILTVTTTSNITNADTVNRNGHSEFFVTGTLKDWTVIDDLDKIKVPTLVINGPYDEAQDETVEPFVRLIPDVKWERIANTSHSPQWEERENYIKVVGDFLTAEER